ncbi:MAG: tRNA pseudouridine(55) synthase TruB [Steroidobacteraceae bacterium]|nr:tRNA pseudouridine(55) synthase TruB [Steroidobacteraceae bacterium]
MNAAPEPRLPRPRVAWRDVDGILLLDKPLGLSSNEALQRVRRILRAAKAGHTGSLDPLASGLLPLCFGQATKISGMLLDADKHYRVRARLGERTASGDREGEVVERLPVPTLDPGALEAGLARFRGPIRQVPPMYSALKHDGERLYVLARQGVEVEREAREVTIHSLELVGRDGDELELEVGCSKGTYIRTLVEDLARAWGTCGHVTMLRRTELGPFTGLPMHTLEALETAEAAGEEALAALLLAPDVAVADWPAVHLREAEVSYLLQGQGVFVAGPPGARVRMYGPGDRFLGVGQMTPEGRRLAPVRLMINTAKAAATPGLA